MYWYIACSIIGEAGGLYNLFNQEFVSYILNDLVNQSTKNCSGELTQVIPITVTLISLLPDAYNRISRLHTMCIMLGTIVSNPDAPSNPPKRRGGSGEYATTILYHYRTSGGTI